jgi:hypothetical protein
MSEMPVEVEGTVHEDGTLELDKKLSLPAGRVKVTVKPVPATPPGEDLWNVLERIWAEQKARGYVPRTREEIDAEVQAFRDEVEEHFLAIEKLQGDCEKARQQQAKDAEPTA